MSSAGELAGIFTEAGRRKRLLHHVTRASYLPNILASRALLPAGERQANHMHGWGANRELGEHLVCLSLKPHWGILKQFQGEEAVILSFSPESITALPAVRPCPMNSAKREATRYLRGEVDPATAARECVSGEAWRDAEVLISAAVPVSLIQLVTFCDQDCRDRWAAALNETVAGHEVELSRGLRTRVAAPENPPRLPRDYRPTQRGPVGPGADQRRRPVPVPVPAPVVDPDAVDWWDEEEEEPISDDHGDLYEQLYGSAAIERSIEDFYPDAEQES